MSYRHALEALLRDHGGVGASTAECRRVVVTGVQVVNLLDLDRDAKRHFFSGARNPSQNELSNVQMAYNIYETALEVGARRVVCNPSNHAADYCERLILDDK